jgi:uncharacterized membrane protein
MLSHNSSYFWRTVTRTLIPLLFVVLLFAAPIMGAESGDSTLFLAGFNAYQKGDYRIAVEKLSKVLTEYPTTPLRDMTLFWLARSNYRSGDRIGAALNMSLFLKEFPDHPLKETVEEDLLASAQEYDRGTKGTQPETTGSAPSAAKVVPKQPDTPQASPQQGTAVAAASPNMTTPTAPPEVKSPAQATQPNVTTASAPAPVVTGAVTAPPNLQKSTTAYPSSAVVATDIPTENKKTVLAAAPVPVSQPSGKKSKRSRKQKNKALKEQAIADYRATMEQYPGTTAAVEAEARLRTLGVEPVPAPQREAAPVQQRDLPVRSSAGASHTVTIEVDQFSDLTIAVTPPVARPEAGRRYAIPVAVANNGNGPDSFSLESGFPVEFAPRFVTSASELPLTSTPFLAPGEGWNGFLLIDVPKGSVDGQKLRYPVRAVSRFSTAVSRTSELVLAVSAPLLRGVVKPAQDSVKQGDQILYRMTLLNVGSAPVRGAFVRLDYPSALEPVSYPGFLHESGNLLLENIDLASGGSRELTVTFRLKKGSPARQELICRGELSNPALQTKTIFVSPAATVSAVSGIALSLNQERMVAVPGQLLSVPVSVTNSGNIKEPVSLSAALPAGFTVQFYRDVQGNGQRDSREPAVTGSVLLAPDETQHFIMSVVTPPETADRTESTLSIAAESVSGSAVKAAATLRISFARPVVELSLAGEGGRLKPGEIAIVELTCLNRGSAVARSVSLESMLPEQLEVVATEPVASLRGKDPVWVIAELGAGEKRIFRIISRVRHGIRAGSSLSIAGKVYYEDYQGNRY